MSKTNYELLEENKSNVIEYADSIKSSPAPDKNTLAIKYTQVQQMVFDADLDSAIRKLDEIKDNKIGII